MNVLVTTNSKSIVFFSAQNRIFYEFYRVASHSFTGGLPVSVSYRPSSVGIFGMVLVLRWG